MSRKLITQSILYILMGALVYVADLGSFSAMVHFAPDRPLEANAIAKVIGATLGFFLHKYVTFSDPQRDGVLRQGLRYALLLLMNVVLGSALLHLLLGSWPLPVVPTRILVDGVIIVASFFASRSLVFNPQ